MPRRLVAWTMPGSKRAYARTLLATIDFLAEACPPLPLAASGSGHGGRHEGPAEPGSHWEVVQETVVAAGTASVAAAALMVVPLAWRQELDRAVPRGYHIIDLGPLRPLAINNVGQIVGTPMSGIKPRGHRWDAGSWIDLADREDLCVTPTDINDRGQVTGWYEIFLEPASQTVTPGGLEEREAKYSPLKRLDGRADQRINLPADDLGTLGGERSRGLVINNPGQVAGTSSLAPTFPLDFAWIVRFARHRTGRSTRVPISSIASMPSKNHHFVLGVAMNNLGDVIINTLGMGRPAFHTAPGRTIGRISVGLEPDDKTGMEVSVAGINDRCQVIARVRGMWHEDVDQTCSASIRIDGSSRKPTGSLVPSCPG